MWKNFRQNYSNFDGRFDEVIEKLGNSHCVEVVAKNIIEELENG